jgi:drug/metabolite transporter (DMT)-like permease
MKLRGTFFAVVAIWSTTPLAIAWGATDVGFIPAITWRMVPAAVLSFLLCKAFGIQVHWHRQAISSYLAAGLGMFGAMTMAYWASQYIESGMLSVIFGMTPVLSGLLSIKLLGEPFFSPGKLIALMVALGGFALMFSGELGVSERGTWALIVLFAAVWVFSLSAVLVKKIDLGGHPLAQSSGALMISTPLFVVLYFLTGAASFQDASLRAVISISYLVVFGSIFGFVGYFYILQRMSPRDVGLLNLIAPVFALWLGAIVNEESLDPEQWLGAALVLTSLAMYQWAAPLVAAWKSMRER